MSVRLARELAVYAVALPFVDHALVGDVRVFRIGGHREEHEVAEFELGGAGEAFEKAGRCAHDAEIDVFRGSSTIDAQLHNDTPLEHHGVAKLAGNAREESVEHEELPSTGEVRTARRRGTQSRFERLLEGRGGRVGDHAALARARMVFTSSLSISPRARACLMAASMSSGDTCAATQSRSVRSGLVTGMAPISSRSVLGRSAW